MLTVTFIIAIIALLISVLAYRRAGGAKELRKTVDSLSSTMESLKDRAGEGIKEKVEDLTSTTESLRDRTADAIDRFEKVMRGKPKRRPSRPRGPQAEKE